MKERTSVEFRILSATLSAADVQTRLGLAPDESWKAGDARGPFNAVEKLHGFILQSKQPDRESLDEHVKAMLKRLAPYATKIGTLAAESRIEFACILQRQTAPRLKFERDDLRWLGVMGAQLDVDFKILVEPPKLPPKPPTPGTPSF